MSEIDTSKEAEKYWSEMIRFSENHYPPIYKYNHDFGLLSRFIEALVAERDAAVARAEKAEAERDYYRESRGVAMCISSLANMDLRARVAALFSAAPQPATVNDSLTVGAVKESLTTAAADVIAGTNVDSITEEEIAALAVCGMSSTELISYCRHHCETERALFSGAQLSAISFLAGKVENGRAWRDHPDIWRSISEAWMKPVCAQAQERLDRLTNGEGE